MIKLLFWAAKAFKTYIIVVEWVAACIQSDSKRATVKYYTYVFQIFSGN